MPTEETKRRVAELLEEMRDLTQFTECHPLEVNSKGFNEDTPLIVALRRRDLQSVIDLLEMGADPNAVGEDDFSALHIAAMKGVEFVRPLLAYGAVPRGRNMFGDTPQDVARLYGDPVVMALLDMTSPG